MCVSLLFCAVCSLSLPGNKNKMGFLLDFCHSKRLTPRSVVSTRLVCPHQDSLEISSIMDISERARSP